MKVGSYEVDVIHDARLTREHNKASAAGAFYAHYNSSLAAFAAYHYQKDNHEVGLQLLQLLLTADPGMEWSTPYYPMRPIKEIVDDIKKGGDLGKEFIKERAEFWKWALQEFAPAEKESGSKKN